MSQKLLSTILLLLPLVFVACVENSAKTSIGAGTTDGTNAPNVFNAGEDPLSAYAWHLNNTAQSTFAANPGVAGADISVKAVHDSGIKGDGVTIAVSDTGVDVNHPDLTDNQLSGQHRDYSGEVSANWRGGDPYPDEFEGHGTAVAGLSAAEGWNGYGSRGIAPNAKFAGFYFIGDFQSTAASYEAKTLDQMSGTFDIFNYSYGYPGCGFFPTTQSVIDAYKYGVTNLRAGKGAIYVKAVGNDYIGRNADCYTNSSTSFLGNSNTSEDQNHPYLILAAAMNAKGKISSYSTPGSGVWVASLGGEYGTADPAMLSTDIQGCAHGISESASAVAGFNKGVNALNGQCDYTSIMNGTSSASPVLSGVVALLLAANPALTWRDVKHILAVTADKVNFSTDPILHPAGVSGALSGYVYDYLYVHNQGGFDYSNTYGFGRVNANSAVNMAKTYVSALGTYQESAYQSSGTLSLSIPDKNATGVTNAMSVATNLRVESVQIKISTTHTFVGDLGVQLTSPQGTTSRLLLINSNIRQSGLTDFTLLSNAFYGELSPGTWTIKIVDGATNNTGTFTNWKLRISGHTP